MKKLITVSAIYFVFTVLVMFALSWAGLPGDYVAGGATAVVGYLAYLVYELQKIHQSSDAAKILVLEVRNAERALLAVRAEPTPSAWTKVVMTENSWARYRQLFVSVLDSDEYEQLDRFFHNWAQLVTWKVETEVYGRAQLAAKAGYVQEQLLALPLSPDYDRKRQEIIARANGEQWMFEPDYVMSRVGFFVNALQTVSGTTGYAKLRKHARLPS